MKPSVLRESCNEMYIILDERFKNVTKAYLSLKNKDSAYAQDLLTLATAHFQAALIYKQQLIDTGCDLPNTHEIEASVRKLCSYCGFPINSSACPKNTPNIEGNIIYDKNSKNN